MKSPDSQSGYLCGILYMYIVHVHVGTVMIKYTVKPFSQCLQNITK